MKYCSMHIKAKLCILSKILNHGLLVKQYIVKSATFTKWEKNLQKYYFASYRNILHRLFTLKQLKVCNFVKSVIQM